MIYLIRLNHRYQLDGYDDGSQLFYKFLSQKTVQLRSDLVGEELNIEALTIWSVARSVAQKVAEEKCIRHIFVDPDSCERERLGIKGFKEISKELDYGSTLTLCQEKQVEAIEKSYWEKREEFWLSVLMPINFSRCILIIGANHICRFCDLLNKKRIQFTLIEKDFND